MVIYVDIDETICCHSMEKSHSPRNYKDAFPIKENIQKINKLYDDGNSIVYWTARGTTTKICWKEITLSQLKEWGVKFHELKFGKPPYDLMICDKSKRIEEI